MSQADIDKTLSGQDVTQWKYQLSIGTSIALETLFGINDNIKPTNPLPYKKYNFVMFNVKTLIRNLYGAVTKELKSEWTANKYLEKILKELEMIPLILDDQSHGSLNAIYYIPTYKSLEKEYPNAILKKVSGKALGSMHYEAIEQYCIAQLTAKVLRNELVIAMVDCKLYPVESPGAIITHLPIDLIQYRHSNLIDLIETHTGNIKPRSMWYTKLNGSGLERIPFDAWSIQWFGDGKMFSPYPPKYRKAILTLATDNKWNQTTTPKLISVQMKRIPEAEIRADLAKLF